MFSDEYQKLPDPPEDPNLPERQIDLETGEVLNETPPVTPLEQARRLAAVRLSLEEQAKVVERFWLAIQATDLYREYSQAQADLDALKKAEAEEKEALGDAIVVEFGATGERKFPFGQLKRTTSLEFDLADAKEWALDHDHSEMLNLDLAKFKKAAKVLELDFVEELTINKPFINGDLSKFLSTPPTE